MLTWWYLLRGHQLLAAPSEPEFESWTHVHDFRHGGAPSRFAWQDYSTPRAREQGRTHISRWAIHVGRSLAMRARCYGSLLRRLARRRRRKPCTVISTTRSWIPTRRPRGGLQRDAPRA